MGTELCAHDAGASSSCNSAANACFDGFENVNVAAQNPGVVASLSVQLHGIVAERSPRTQRQRHTANTGRAEGGGVARGLGDDDGDGAQATTNDVESEDIFDSAEKPQNQVIST